MIEAFRNPMALFQAIEHLSSLGIVVPREIQRNMLFVVTVSALGTSMLSWDDEERAKTLRQGVKSLRLVLEWIDQNVEPIMAAQMGDKKVHISMERTARYHMTDVAFPDPPIKVGY